MFKYFKIVCKEIFPLLGSSRWLNKYIKHKDKYFLDERYSKVRAFLRKFNKNFDVKFIIKGEENLPKDSNFLLVCNHQSNMDPISFIDYFENPTTFVSKKEVLKFPYAGKMLQAIDGVFMDRNDFRSEVKSISVASKILKETNANVVIFPEGTRSKNVEHSLNEFKAGSLKIAYNANKPIVVACIQGGYRVLDKKLKMKNYPIQITFIKTYYPSYYKDIKTNDLIKQVESSIDEELKIMKKTDEELVDIYKLKRSKKDHNIVGL